MRKHSQAVEEGELILFARAQIAPAVRLSFCAIALALVPALSMARNCRCW